MDSEKLQENIIKKDQTLSNRHIDLDPAGYFLIKIDHNKQTIIVEHFMNKIDNEGYALDPNTNEPIKCDSNIRRKHNLIFRGQSAKEVGILITEKRNDLISKLEHALYLGRELQKAEQCLIEQSTYIQD